MVAVSLVTVYVFLNILWFEPVNSKFPATIQFFYFRLFRKFLDFCFEL